MMTKVILVICMLFAPITSSIANDAPEVKPLVIEVKDDRRLERLEEVTKELERRVRSLEEKVKEIENIKPKE